MGSCISSFSYIKPQLRQHHRGKRVGCISSFSYIKPQLRGLQHGGLLRCISSFSYIKPQLMLRFIASVMGCISSFSYIKPQLLEREGDEVDVVYHPFPTSNHNCAIMLCVIGKLYIILFLHQTTTQQREGDEVDKLYIILFLHQTTTLSAATTT